MVCLCSRLPGASSPVARFTFLRVLLQWIRTCRTLVFGFVLGTLCSEVRSYHHDSPLGTKRPYYPLEAYSRPKLLRNPPAEGIDLVTACPSLEVSDKEAPIETREENDPIANISHLRYVAVVARHGARFPTVNKMAAVTDLAERICRAAEDDGVEVIPSGAKDWCLQILRDADGVRPGSLSALGAREMEDLGRDVGAKYLWGSTASLDVSIRTSSSQRCQSSCDSFLNGAVDFWVGTEDKHYCQNVDDRLLRPYKSCALLQEVRQAFEPPLDQDLVERAIRKISAVSGLPVEELQAADVHGAYYGCQTDVALGYGQVNTTFACSMLGVENMQPFDMEEDLENFLLRGYGRHDVTREVMSPLLQHITDQMSISSNGSDNDSSERRRRRRRVELFFTHDSTVLPLAALMNLFDLGENAETSEASKMCPFASRLVVELFDCGTILVYYNGMLVRSFVDLEEWNREYHTQLAVDISEACALPGHFDTQGPNVKHDEL
ncbi:unnamed protein product [Choristocarpus tenellus]